MEVFLELVLMAAWVWIIVIAFTTEDHVWWGVACIVFFLIGTVLYSITHLRKTCIPFGILAFGSLVVFNMVVQGEITSPPS